MFKSSLKRSILIGCIVSLFTILIGFSTNAQTSPKELNFGIISTESQANQRPLWEPFIADMSKKLGVTVKPFYSTQYAGVIEGMRFKKVDIAWFGGKAYIEAANRANGDAFAQTVSDKGERGYYSYLIMNKNNPEAAKAKAMGGEKYMVRNASKLTFAFNDPNSTSGYLVPSYYVFAKNNIDPKKAFKKLIFAGSHESTALAVANNKVDVATNNNESLQRLQKTNPEAFKNIVIVWTSPIIPSDPIAYRKDLPESLKQKIRNFFYSYNNKAILGPLQWSKFVPATDKTWNSIRELEIGKKILEVQSKDDMNAAEKARQIAALRKELAALK
ncbi:MAG: phosphonate ABC transporter substrate-binding protein [Leptolyngbyaceae bacterium]|nr:phosphonate ABC transporter substrate-binding protein [Leptolyngbyaceae bacterium]